MPGAERPRVSEFPEISEAPSAGRRTLAPLLALRPYIVRHPLMVLAACIALVVSAAAMLAVPVAVRRMIDYGFTARDGIIDWYFAALIGVGMALAIARS